MWSVCVCWGGSAGNLEEAQELSLMSPAVELSRSMNSILRSEPARVDIFQVGPKAHTPSSRKSVDAGSQSFVIHSLTLLGLWVVCRCSPRSARTHS